MKKETQDQVWDKKFELLKEFVELNGKFPAKNDEFEGEKIGSWLNYQKVRYDDKKLDFSRQEKLMAIGVIDKITKFDEDGNNIYTKFSDGFKVWSYYNNGILIHTIDSDGREGWYNENGDLIKFTNRNEIDSSKLYLDPDQHTNEFNIDEEYEEDDESLADKLAIPILVTTLLNTLIMVYYIFS